MSLQPIGNVPETPNHSDQLTVRHDMVTYPWRSMKTYIFQMPQSGGVQNALTMLLNLQLLELPQGEGHQLANSPGTCCLKLAEDPDLALIMSSII